MTMSVNLLDTVALASQSHGFLNAAVRHAYPHLNMWLQQTQNAGFTPRCIMMTTKLR